jgi:malate dehydrogenase (oxaloacetate-decarboxylating)
VSRIFVLRSRLSFPLSQWYRIRMKKPDVGKKALALHKKLKGKLRISAAARVKNRADLSLVYTPGVAAVSTYLAVHPEKAGEYTMKGRMVAVVSDGSAVLGLGNIGPYGALPVMEGKCALFKEFAGVDAVPIVLTTQDPDKIVETVMNIAPAFGGINLEDIGAPKCFDIERRLVEKLDIPVMHDDQHGTAIVVLAALLNAAKVVKKDLRSLKAVVLGAGAAGTAITKLLLLAGLTHVVVVDSKGILHHGRNDLTTHKHELAHATSQHGLSGELRHALKGADVLIGVSGPNLVKAEHIRLMAKDPIVFAMANPTPEIMPEEAKKGGAAVIATGRSDYPNQVNNSLVFPGLFRGALDHQVRAITDRMKLKAAYALATLVKNPTAGKIIPDMFDKRAPKAVAEVIR